MSSCRYRQINEPDFEVLQALDLEAQRRLAPDYDALPERERSSRLSTSHAALKFYERSEHSFVADDDEVRGFVDEAIRPHVADWFERAEFPREIVAEMKRLAPVESGKLRDSINWTWGDVPAGSFTIADIRSGKNAGEQYATLRIKIYAGSREAYYARWQALM